MRRRSRRQTQVVDEYIECHQSENTGHHDLEPELADLIESLGSLDQDAWGLSWADIQSRARFGRFQRTLKYSGLALVLVLFIVTASIASFTLRPAPPAGAKSWSLAGYVGTAAWSPASQSRTSAGLVASCPSTETCVEVNTSATGAQIVEVTNDFGRTWLPTALPLGASITSGVSCPSTYFCMFGGRDSGATGFWISTNPGSAWRFQPVPLGAMVVNDVSCIAISDCAATAVSVSAPSGLVMGTTFLSTNDAGSTWSSEVLPSGFSPSAPSSLWCDSPLRCLVAGTAGSDGLGADPSGGAVASTADGGHTWELASAPDSLLVVGQISCSVVSDCAAIGRPADPTNPEEILISRDSGRTWKIATGSPVTQPQTVECRSGGGCLVGGTAVDHGQPVPAIARTPDLGVTWLPEPVPSALPGPDGKTVQLVLVAEIACAPSSGPCLATATGSTLTTGGIWAALTDSG